VVQKRISQQISKAEKNSREGEVGMQVNATGQASAVGASAADNTDGENAA